MNVWTYYLRPLQLIGEKPSNVCVYCNRTRQEHAMDMCCPIPNCTLLGPPDEAVTAVGIRIGKFVLSPGISDDSVSITKPDGEGGGFSIEKLEKHLEEFYDREF